MAPRTRPIRAGRIEIDRRLGVVAIVLASAASVLAPVPVDGAAPDPPPYRIHDLGTLGGESSHAYDINSHGVVVGSSTLPDRRMRGFVWDPATGEMQNLGDAVAGADALNDAGVVVGMLNNQRAYARDPVTGHRTNLGTLPGGTTSHPHAVSEEGIVVGYGGTHAFLWSPETEQMTDLDTLGGYSDAMAINSAGVVAGESETESGELHAYVRDPATGALNDLGTLGGDSSRPWAMNEAGVVVGGSDTGSRYSAFVWDPRAGDMTDLDDVAPFDGHWHEAFGINDAGMIVGDGELVDGQQRGLLYDPATGETTVLGGLGGSFSEASAINDAGMVVGTARTPDGEYHAVLWVPDFADVPLDHPFLPDISWMATRRIAGGFLDGTFRPGQPVTRQAAAAFLYRLAGAPDGDDPTCSSAPFDDVGIDDPFCGEIAWLAGEGIADGYPDGGFHPDGTVTRQATAAFLYRLDGSPDGDPPICSVAPFADVDASHPFCGEIEWMADAGISDGYADGTFRPAALVTRQAASAFLHRFDGLP